MVKASDTVVGVSEYLSLAASYRPISIVTEMQN